MSELNSKLKDQENEKVSLLTVINIIQSEHRDSNKSRLKDSSKGKKFHGQNWNVQLLATSNRYSVLAESDNDTYESSEHAKSFSDSIVDLKPADISKTSWKGQQPREYVLQDCRRQKKRLTTTEKYRSNKVITGSLIRQL